jgi:hypothetical protein
VNRFDTNNQDGYGVSSMLKKDKTARDAFALSQGGMKVITAFAAAPTIAYDRLYQVRRNGPQTAVADCGRSPSLLLSGLSKATRATFA